MKIILKIILVFFLFSQETSAADGTNTVKLFVEAFNKRDVNSMLNLSASDMRWMSISGHTIATETSNHSELKKAMLSYFESTPTAKSEIRHLNESGSFVYALEQAFWSVKGVEKSQCNMAVYELAERKIKHVWYFPTHQCM